MIDKMHLELFKSGKLNDLLFLGLLRDNIKSQIPIAVEFGKSPNATTSVSYVCSFLPVKTNKVSKMIIYFDKDILKKMDTNNLSLLLSHVANYILKVQYEYAEFLRYNKGMDIAKSQYLKTFVFNNYKFIKKIEESDNYKDIHDNIKLSAYSDVLELLDDDNVIADVVDIAIEKIKYNNVLPAETLAFVRKFLSVSEEQANIAELEVDKYFNEIINLSTSQENPYWSKEVDEDATIKSGRRVFYKN